MDDLWKDGDLTLRFWAYGSQYTIVPGRHIGADQAPNPGGEPWDVPALVEADVHHTIQTTAIGRVVVTDTHRATRRYISYCHGFYGDPAAQNDHLKPGDRVMRLARAWESPGTAWDGVHCHVVVHDNPEGAYTRVGDTYYDPIDDIDRYRTSTAGGTPRPLLLEDSMAIIIRRQSDGLIGLIDKQMWAWMPDMETALINAAVYSVTDEIHELDNDGFDRVTRSAGIPDEVRAPSVFWSIDSVLQQQLRDLQQQLQGLEAKLGGK